jgi:hypothetical protein
MRGARITFGGRAAAPFPRRPAAHLQVERAAALEHGGADLGALGVQQARDVAALVGGHSPHAVQHLWGFGGVGVQQRGEVVS